jgi:putative inorganic carbon (HCO3(-)) transporter
MIRTAIVAICFLIGIGATIRSRFGALMFYVWFAIFRPTDYLWFSITEYRPSFLVGLTLVASSAATGVLPLTSHPLWVGSLLFWFFALVAQQFAVVPDLAFSWLIALGIMIVVSALIVRLTTAQGKIYALVAVMAGSFAFFAAKAGLFSLMSGGARYGEGLGTGAFTDNNAYALGCAMVVPLLLAVGQTTQAKWARYGWWAAALLTGFTVISTFSRGGFLALGSTALVFVLLQPRAIRKLVVAAALAMVAAAVVPIPEGYLDRLQTIDNYDEIQEESALSRLHVWSVALSIARDHPMGIGLWNFESVYDRYDPSEGEFGRSRAVHNSHLEALVETGWVGGAVWEALILGGIYTAWRTRKRAIAMGDRGVFIRRMADGFITSQVAFFVGGTFIAMAYNDLTWLGLGCVAALDRIAVAEAALVPQPAASLGTAASTTLVPPGRPFSPRSGSASPRIGIRTTG